MDLQQRTGNTSFMCEKDQFTDNELKDYSKEKGITVIIRKYGVIKDGKLQLFH